jgi:hypothetical protein
MSWDIFVQDIPEDVNKVQDMRERYSDYQPRPIGKRSEIVKKIKEIVPAADFSNTNWGVIEEKNFSIEIDVGEDEECQGFCLHVRGDMNAVSLISKILKHLNLRAFDPGSETGLFEFDNRSIDSFSKWNEYRQRVFENER